MLLNIRVNERSDEEKKEINRLRPKYSRDKKKYPNLVEERERTSVAATDADRQAKARQNMSEVEKEEALAAARERMAQPEQLAAARERMAQPQAQAADRARKEDRRRNPALPKPYLWA